MESISILRRLIAICSGRGGTLWGYPGCVEQVVPGRLCSWARKGQYLDVEVAISVMEASKFHCDGQSCHFGDDLEYWETGEDGFGSRSQVSGVTYHKERKGRKETHGIQVKVKRDETCKK